MGLAAGYQIESSVNDRLYGKKPDVDSPKPTVGLDVEELVDSIHGSDTPDAKKRGVEDEFPLYTVLILHRLSIALKLLVCKEFHVVFIFGNI